MLHAVGLLQGLSSIALLPMTSKKRGERKKKSQFGYSEILLLRGKLHLRAWVCFSFLLSSFSFLIQYSLALQSLPPPSYCPVFSLCLCSYLSFSRLWLRLCSVLSSVFFFFFPSTPSLSLSFVFPAPRFLSLGELWIREAFWCQTATILHVNKKDGWKHSGSRTGTFFFLLVCHLVGKSSYLLQQRSIIIIGSRLWLRSY